MSVAERFPLTGRNFTDLPAPDRVRMETARLMADGRWRNARDVAYRINVPISAASAALRRLESLGILQSQNSNEPPRTLKLYRAIEKKDGQQ